MRVMMKRSVLLVFSAFVMLIPIVSAAKVKEAPPMPAGFAYDEGTIEKGFVIKDTFGNEFVWVPVPESLARINWPSQTVSVEETVEEIPPEIKDSIQKYQGFYVARYEATFKNELRVKSRPIIDSLVWDAVDWYMAKWVCEKMAADYGYQEVNTHLMYDAEWDAILVWLKKSGINLEDSREYGVYLDAPFVTTKGCIWRGGAFGKAKTNNIFDLAGNVREWTMARYGTTDRVTRGGSCWCSGLKDNIASRKQNHVTGVAADLGFRPVMVLTQ